MAVSVQAYIDSLPEESRVSRDLYQNRLHTCTGCSLLADGTCRLCGCYVEARAAKKGLSCPHVPPLW